MQNITTHTVRSLAFYFIEGRAADFFGVPVREFFADKPDSALLWWARACGMVYGCHGCGSVGGIDPLNLGDHADTEAARRATRDNLGPWECCGHVTVL